MAITATSQTQDSGAKQPLIETPQPEATPAEVGKTEAAAPADGNDTATAGFYCSACMQQDCQDCSACYAPVGCYGYVPGSYACPYPYPYGAYPPYPATAAPEEFTASYFGEYPESHIPYGSANGFVQYYPGCPDCAQCAECSFCCYGQPPMYNDTACPPWLAQSEEALTAPAAIEPVQPPQPAFCVAEPPVAVEAVESVEETSSAGVELTPEQLHSVDPVRYKTRLCTAFQQGRQCEYGDRCLFAHGPDDLRFPASNFAALLRAGKLPRHIRKYYTAKFLGDDVEEIPASAS